MIKKERVLFHFLNNWKSALTVSLVSIPLAIALTLASGGTPTQGIITAFAAGLLGAFFGGSHFNIIGPTGALSGILVAYAINNGGATLPLVAIISGVIILILYFLRFDKYIIFIPGSVVHGFTLGVAFIIGLGQLDNMLGIQGKVKVESILVNTANSLSLIADTSFLSLGLFLFSVFFIIFWNKKYPKLPGAVIMALVGILVVYLLKVTNSPLHITSLGDKYHDIHATLFENHFNNYKKLNIWGSNILFVSSAIAIIAILETLLSGQIAQNMTKIAFNRKKEVLGLAIANIGTGLMGGIPATAALARTALNIRSGAIHRASGLLNAVFVALIALFLLNFFTMLPLAIIAAILFGVAIGMVETKHFVHYYKHEKVSFILSIFVAVVTLMEDPIIGILAGTSIALIIFVNKISVAQSEILLWKDYKMTETLLSKDFMKKESVNSDIIVYKISGMLTYINMPSHLEMIKKIKDNKFVIISLRSAFYADSDGIHYLKEIIEILKSQNERLYLSSVNKEIEKYIKEEEFYRNKLVEGKIYDRTSDAINDIMANQKLE